MLRLQKKKKPREGERARKRAGLIYKKKFKILHQVEKKNQKDQGCMV